MTLRIRPPTGSRFRPAGPIDQSLMQENKALIARIDRRKVLRGSLSLGALTLLGGCDVTDTDTIQKVLTAMSLGISSVARCRYPAAARRVAWSSFGARSIPVTRFTRS